MVGINPKSFKKDATAKSNGSSILFPDWFNEFSLTSKASSKGSTVVLGLWRNEVDWAVEVGLAVEVVGVVEAVEVADERTDTVVELEAVIAAVVAVAVESVRNWGVVEEEGEE